MSKTSQDVPKTSQDIPGICRAFVFATGRTDRPRDIFKHFQCVECAAIEGLEQPCGCRQRGRRRQHGLRAELRRRGALDG
jgi:hypothetical protein